MSGYLPILLLVGLSTAFAVGIIWIAHRLGGTSLSKADQTIYECGVEPADMAGKRFPIRFHRVAMLFILFDVEVAFIFPWAVAYSDLRLFGLIEMVLFLVILTGGYIYVWREGGFSWN